MKKKKLMKTRLMFFSLQNYILLELESSENSSLALRNRQVERGGAESVNESITCGVIQASLPGTDS